jgi:alkanesulfonate monooxygenase SsuD/methylene tetrahydromethanopterin reductase-like flavin-dependent oxidoreductase (luciferase family)
MARDGGPHIGIRPPHHFFERGVEPFLEAVAKIGAAGLDHVTVGDHVSFRGGVGQDGLVQSTALAVTTSDLEVHTGVYLLPLRHPVTVARQIATLAQLAPGRFVFGCGIGGEDRAEVLACGVDPATRGRRMDESLHVLRALLAGERVTYPGDFFDLHDVAVRPSPRQPVPVIVGGRSAVALRRAGRYGDGWLGVWVSPGRYASAVETVEAAAVQAGREDVSWRHGLHVWCGFGGTHEAATAQIAEVMSGFYGVPFEKFERYTPRGTAQDVAEYVLPYVAAGCHDIHLLPVARDDDEAIDSCGAVRQLVLAELGVPGPARQGEDGCG